MMQIETDKDMKNLGRLIGEKLRGGEVIELVGDVGAGKTTLVKGIGQGLQLEEDVQSPSFTISRVYPARDGLELHHYDFYRLQEAGVMSHELSESIDRKTVITIIEWADTVQDVLPEERITIRLAYTPHGNGREVTSVIAGRFSYLQETL